MSLLRALADVVVSRLEMARRLGKTHRGRRDLWKVLGYPDQIDFEEYRQAHRRGGIAKRVIEAPVTDTWADSFELIEEDEPDVETDFEKAWTTLSERLGILERLMRVDIMAGIGRYGVLVVGLRGQKLEEEAKPVKGPDDVLYLSAYSEGRAKIERLETDTSSERFGKPLLYKLKLADDELMKGSTDLKNEAIAHASRVVHFADGALDDDVYGTPRLEAPWNDLLDLVKVVGGSAEMFWRAADRGMSFEMDADLVDLTPEQKEELRKEIDAYVHEQQKYMRLRGVSAKPLGGQVADPRGPSDAVLSLISAATSIPKRILLGSEAAQLASGQDRSTWLSRMKARQTNVAGPRLIRKLVDLLVGLNAIPKPVSYDVEWPDPMALSESDKATIGVKRSQTVKTLEGSTLVTPAEAREMADLPAKMEGKSVAEETRAAGGAQPAKPGAKPGLQVVPDPGAGAAAE